MEEKESDFCDCLNLGTREHVALVGGGGKTSLMFTLSAELVRRGRRVVTGTTTKVSSAEARRAPQMVLCDGRAGWQEEVRRGLDRFGQVFVAGREVERAKVEGIPVALADRLYQDPMVDFVLLEADGAARRPVKAPDEHEPLIPPSVTRVIALLGLEAIGGVVGPELVFRVPLFEAVGGQKLGERIALPALAALFRHPRGVFKGSPVNARRTVLLNKADLLPDPGPAQALAELIWRTEGVPIDEVLIGSVLGSACRRTGGEKG